MFAYDASFGSEKEMSTKQVFPLYWAVQTLERWTIFWHTSPRSINRCTTKHVK